MTSTLLSIKPSTKKCAQTTTKHPASQDHPEVYYGWHEVPTGLMTGSKWKWSYSRKPVASSTAVVVWDSDTLWPRRAKLYSYDQTRSFQPSERTKALRWFCEVFQLASSRNRYLWTAGKNWISCQGKLSRREVRRHLQQDDVYGAVGGSFTRFVAIDLDLHKGDDTIFLRQLDILLKRFWSNGPWFIQVAENDAAGAHLICILPEPELTSVIVDSMRQILLELDRSNAALAQGARAAGMKSLAELEIYPDPNYGFRLPFARGRTLLLDRPLDLVTHRKKQVADVVGLMKWYEDKNRQQMPASEVICYVAGRLELTNTKRISTTSSSEEICEPSRVHEKWEMKGRYRQFLVEYWSGKINEPDSLNKGLHLLATMAPYYFPSNPSRAVRCVEHMIDDLPDWSFSSRLSSGNREAVSADARRMIEAAYTNLCQNSRMKLNKTYQSWSNRRFNPFDRSTWTLEKLNIACDWIWSEEEMAIVRSIGNMLKCEVGVADDLIRRLVRFIAVSGREMSVNYVKTVMLDVGIKVGSKRDNKAKQLIDRMIALKWIYVRAQAATGRARAYGIGEELKLRIRRDVPAVSDV